MNDPKEIAREIARNAWDCAESPDELADAIAAALQAEREDGCRRVNDAIGDRDPIIEKLKAELERVKAERDEAVRLIHGAANVFYDYAVKHKNKHTPEGDVKAEANYAEWRKLCAFTEKLDIRNPLPYNTPDEQPQAGEAEHEAET